MTGLERTSHCVACADDAGAYRTRHQPRELLARHPHRRGFAAIVLTGRYVEAGDSGRHAMAPGDILIHRPWERHLDRIENTGAEVLVLDMMDRDCALLHGRVGDPDEIARLAEIDPGAALDRALATSVATGHTDSDWPELLARAIRADPELSIGDWALRARLHLGSISRGFRQVFGITPKAYRLTQRTLRALEMLPANGKRLSEIAHDCRFADQAHMARAIKAATAMSAGAVRASAGKNDQRRSPRK